MENLCLCLQWLYILDGQNHTNRQVQAFSERGQLSQAIPQLYVDPVLHEWMPIAWFESQHNEPSVQEDQFLIGEGEMIASERYC